MSSSVIIANSPSVQTFDLYALRFEMIARGPLVFPVGTAGNLVRGRFGMALRRRHPELYQRLFAPRVSSGPSGLQDSPRPFVLRVRHLEGMELAAGDRYGIGFHLFETGEPLIQAIRDALAQGLAAECSDMECADLRLSLAPPEAPVSRVRVRFLTPAELKPAGPPEFGVLFARIRDRVSTLRALYGAGPLKIDFQALGGRAAEIRMSRCALQQVEAERVSGSTHQRHSLGGFIGEADYEGELGEFIPYLEVARWTGVGRQTVWGKGEIGWETF